MSPRLDSPNNTLQSLCFNHTLLTPVQTSLKCVLATSNTASISIYVGPVLTVSQSVSQCEDGESWLLLCHQTKALQAGVLSHGGTLPVTTPSPPLPPTPLRYTCNATLLCHSKSIKKAAWLELLGCRCVFVGARVVPTVL